jgi:hypothetical protein
MQGIGQGGFKNFREADPPVRIAGATDELLGRMRYRVSIISPLGELLANVLRDADSEIAYGD